MPRDHRVIYYYLLGFGALQLIGGLGINTNAIIPVYGGMIITSDSPGLTPRATNRVLLTESYCVLLITVCLATGSDFDAP
ncbi:hypothetical protein C7475_1011291 [Chitinophaga sp. S165]|nr:hypothetical protein C7475_1011291 [Chitinophaga sp. S165]